MGTEGKSEMVQVVQNDEYEAGTTTCHDANNFIVEDEPKNYTFQVNIQRQPAGMGLDLSPHDGHTLLVGKIRPGPVQEWNQQRGSSGMDRVRPGDRITAGNGVTGDSGDIL